MILRPVICKYRPEGLRLWECYIGKHGMYEGLNFGTYIGLSDGVNLRYIIGAIELFQPKTSTFSTHALI